MDTDKKGPERPIGQNASRDASIWAWIGGGAGIGVVVALLMLVFGSLASEPMPTPEHLTHTPRPTYTPRPTHAPTLTTRPTNVIRPTHVPTVIAGPMYTHLIPCNPLPQGIEVRGTGGDSAGLAAPAIQAPENPYGEMTLGPAAQEGGTYRVGVFADITGLNYFAANGPDATVYNSYMLPGRPSLFHLTALSFEMTPELAAVEEVPAITEREGSLYYVDIPLRDDVDWSDGEPFTADDVAWTANIVLDTGLIGGNWQAWYDGNFLDHAEAINDHTVRFYFTQIPGMARWDYGTLQAPILAEHFWAPLVEAADVMGPIEALGENAYERDLLVAQPEAQDRLYAIDVTGEPTMGAFLLDRWEPGDFIELTANPDYFARGETFTVTDANGEEYTWEVGPFVDTVIYTIYANQDIAIRALRDDEIDFIVSSMGVPRRFREQVETDLDLVAIHNNSLSYRYLTFNTRRQPMNDCSFRQAVAVLIDREYVSNIVLNRAVFPTYSVVPPGNIAYHNPDAPHIGRGLTREQRIAFAVQILQTAGYTWEGDLIPGWDEGAAAATEAGRLTMPGGVRIPDLEYWAPNAGYDPLRATFAIHIEQWLREIGIPVTAHLAGFNILVPRGFTTREFDFFTLGYNEGIFPALLHDVWHSEQDVPGGNNNSGYFNPQYDALADDLLTCATYEDCRDIAFQLQEILATEVPTIALFDPSIMEAYRPDEVEFPFDTTPGGWQYLHQGGDDAQSYVRLTGGD